MSYISTLVASLDARLDELAAEISTLADARAALMTATPTRPITAAAHNGAARKRAPRPARPTKTPAQNRPSPGSHPTAELARPAPNTPASDPPKPRRRAAAKAAPKKRSVKSLSAEELQRLLAYANAGLSAGTIAERAAASYG
jgi:hypothetical protein